MLKYLGFVATMALGISAASAQEVSLAAGINEFGGKVLEQLVSKAKPDETVLVSPYSISAALSLAALGAAGETRNQMEKVLGLPKEVDWSARHAALMAEIKGAKGVAMSVANGIWGARDVTFRPDFEKRAKADFGAAIEAVDFAAPETLLRINGWVSSETRGMIPNLIDQLDPALAAVLVNALYFKGDWAEKFDVKGTEDAPFHLESGSAETVAMMHRRDDFLYAETPEWQAVSLPYAGHEFDMLVVLPREGQKPLGALMAALDAPLAERKGYLGLPKADLSAGAELARVLEDMGMGKAFSASADFSAMCDQAAFISRVIHKTAMKMDEEGTEAAAATAVMMQKLFLPMEEAPPFRMIVDRPYGLALRHRASGVNLFMGVIASPKAQ